MTPFAPDRTALDLPPLRLSGRLTVAAEIARLHFKERLEFDSPLIQAIAGLSGVAVSNVLWAVRCRRQAFNILAKLHRSGSCGLASRMAEQLARSGARPVTAGATPHPMLGIYEGHVENQPRDALTEKFFQDPSRLLNSIVMVLKSPRADEKGVIITNYSYAFPLFARLFDISAIARRYHLVLEPSWSGYCNLDVLCYARFDFPVFVEAYEPADASFIERSQSNLVPVPTSHNWWVDHRVFRPRPEVPKDVDVVMVASWADFKRHLRLFAALRELRSRGVNPSVVLLGYPSGRSRADICRRARYYGVLDLLEIHENLTPDVVGAHVARAKVNIIWSRKEGQNRAMVEGMFADVPCIVREGFNYGFRYPYINPQTGCFATEQELPDRVCWMIENYRQFHPREWVLANMTCQKATQIMSDVIRETAIRRGEKWTTNLVVKVNNLNRMTYWEEADARRFESDYAFLTSTIRR
jgi:glycosyltransferase involved in cell wall biosynthesis